MADESHRRRILRVPRGLSERLWHGPFRFTSTSCFSFLLPFLFLFPQTCLFGMRLSLKLALDSVTYLTRRGEGATAVSVYLPSPSSGKRRDSSPGFNESQRPGKLILRCFPAFVGANRCRTETRAKLKSTQSVLTTAHGGAARWGPSSRVCCFSFGSPWCIFGVFFFFFWLVFSAEFSLFSLLCGLSGEWSGVRKHVIPWFPFKKPTPMLLNASSRQWAVQVSYELTK